MNDVNRRKPRPEAPLPGFFTGMKPNFVSKTLALPFNIAGGIGARFRNIKEHEKPEYHGNTAEPNRRYEARIERDGYTTTEKGMVPTKHSSVPRPPYHTYDILDGGKSQKHIIELESTFDLKNIIPHDKFEQHKARIAAKANNDQKIANAASFAPDAYEYTKDPTNPAPPDFGPESRKIGIPYGPYMRK